jgi:hypothetical protein
MSVYSRLVKPSMDELMPSLCLRHRCSYCANISFDTREMVLGHIMVLLSETTTDTVTSVIINVYG